MNPIIKHIIDVAEKEVLNIHKKEKLNPLDQAKVMIFSNIHRVFTKIGEKI